MWIEGSQHNLIMKDAERPASFFGLIIQQVFKNRGLDIIEKTVFSVPLICVYVCVCVSTHNVTHVLSADLCLNATFQNATLSKSTCGSWLCLWSLSPSSHFLKSSKMSIGICGCHHYSNCITTTAAAAEAPAKVEAKEETEESDEDVGRI